MELAVWVEQPKRDHPDRKRGNDSVSNLLEGRHEVLAGNSADRLLESVLSLLALLEEMSGAHVIGELDRERDHDRSPAVGVDAVGAGAPPAWSLPEDVVAELG